MTLCEQCEQNEAMIQLIDVVQGQKQVVKLCEECAQGKALIDIPKLDIYDNSVAADIFSAFFGPKYHPPRSQEQEALANFQSTGKLSSPEDYDLLRDHLIPMLEKIHGSSEHKGKVPRNKQSKQYQIEKLEQEMQEAIQQELYERAAEIRDSLRKLQA